MITGEHIISFEYSEDVELYKKVKETFLKKLQCKHIVYIDSDKTELLADAAKEINYEWVMFGSHRENPSLEKEIDIIDSMISSNYTRPLRIVIDQDNRLWADNTHSTIAFMLKHGYNSRVKDVPFYIVDLRVTPYRIVSNNGSVLDSKEDIKNAIACAERIKNYVHRGFRRKGFKSWSINELMFQIEAIDKRLISNDKYQYDKRLKIKVNEIIKTGKRPKGKFCV